MGPAYNFWLEIKEKNYKQCCCSMRLNWKGFAVSADFFMTCPGILSPMLESSYPETSIWETTWSDYELFRCSQLRC